LGWFGFNGGSVLSADPGLTSLVLTTTSLAAAAGGLSAAGFVHIFYKNFDLTMFMNGILGGLVGITAGADQMSIMEAIIVGGIGGIVVVLAVSLLDRLKIDDPVGAVAVHLFTGIWGTLAVGIFGELASWNQFMVQLAGVGLAGLFCVVMTSVFLAVIGKVWGLRVDKKEELEGLDQAEHGGMAAYADFRMNQH
jgi:Amt family ammonium transporter